MFVPSLSWWFVVFHSMKNPRRVVSAGSMLVRVEEAWLRGANTSGNLVRPMESVFGVVDIAVQQCDEDRGCSGDGDGGGDGGV